MDCKKALIEASGDMDAALDILRKKTGERPVADASTSKEGTIAVVRSEDGRRLALVALSTQTDFAANTKEVMAVAHDLAQKLLDCPSVMWLVGDMKNGKSADSLAMIRAQTGEDIQAQTVMQLGSEQGYHAFYLHHDKKKAAVVTFEAEMGAETPPSDLANQICMHIVAAHPTPMAVSADQIPTDVLEKERAFRTEEAMSSGKPPEIAAKMVDGRMKKFASELALVEQPFVMDPAKRVKDVLGAYRIRSFKKIVLGDDSIA
jgi:elongation factor Ts